MWKRLSKRNGEFKNIKKAKQETKKMSETIINQYKYYFKPRKYLLKQDKIIIKNVRFWFLFVAN